MTTETKTAQALRLKAEGLTYAEIASRVGSTAGSVSVLLWKARHPIAARAAAKLDAERHPERRREERRRWYVKLTPEQRAERYYKRKCREAGVTPE